MFHQYLGYLLINQKVNRWFYVCSLLILAFQVIFIVADFQSMSFIRNILMLQFIGTLPFLSILTVLQAMMAIQFFIGFLLYKRTYKKYTQNADFRLIFGTKLLTSCILMFKTFFLLPLNYHVFHSFVTSNDSIQKGISAIVLSLHIVLVVPMTFFTYCNKFFNGQQSITYPYLISLPSWIHTYLHVLIIGYVCQRQSLPYLNAFFSAICCIIICINSPFHFQRQPLVNYLNSLIVSAILVSFVTKILENQVQSIAGSILFFLSALCIGYLLYLMQSNFTTKSFFTKLRKSKILFNFVQNHNQLYMYQMLNFSHSVNDILIFLLEHESTCTDLLCNGKTILQKLKQGETPQSLFPLVKQFFISQIQAEYQPRELEGLGQSEIEKVIHEKGKLYLLIVQLTLMKDEQGQSKENLRKAYCFLKEHEELVRKTPSEYGFMAKVELAAILQIIEEELVLTVKKESLSGHYDSKAFEYFEFQDKLEKFKRGLSQVCDINLDFWKQLLYKEPDHLKVKELISKSEKCAKKIEQSLKSMVSKYRRSCLVTYETIFQYSKFVLNCGLTENFNPFMALQTKYKEELEKFIKENIDTENNYFDNTSNTATCIISLDKTDSGVICWSNANFQKAYGIKCSTKRQQDSIKPQINQLIAPFLRQSHQSFLEEFSKNLSLSFMHENVFIYRKKAKLEYIQPCSIQLQIYPSFKLGLKFLVFFKNHSHSKRQQIKVFVIDQNLENTLFTQSLAKQLEHFIDEHDDIGSPFQKFFQSNPAWTSLLNQEQTKIQIKMDMEDSDYKAKLIKTVKNEKGKRFFYFQVFNLMSTPESDEIKYGDTLQTNTQTKNGFQEFMSNTVQSVSQMKHETSKEDQQIIKPRQQRTGTQYLTIQMKKVYESRNQEELALHKIFSTMTTPKTPYKIKVWRIITAILLFLIVAAMVSNIVIAIERKAVYEKDIQMIQNYNKLVNYVARIIITLREYNYHAYSNLSNPSLLFYKKQLEIYQVQVSYLLQQLHNQLTETWATFEFQQTGKLTQKKQIQYVVLANYVLSSITYLSEQPYEAFNFPYLERQFYWFFGMTKAQQNFLNVIWNGMYICLANMLEKRRSLTKLVEDQILRIDKQLFIFPAVCGSFILILFILLSLLIEMKSFNLISQVSTLLQKVSVKSKRQKISKIKLFEQIYIENCLQSKRKLQFDPKQTTFYNSQKENVQTKINPVKGIYDNFEQQPNTVQGLSNFFKGNNHNHSESIESSQQSNETDRDLKESEFRQNDPKNKRYIQSVQGFDFKNKYPQKARQSSNKLCYQTSQEGMEEFKITIDLRSNKKVTYLFYFVLIVPFLAYFLGIFIGGKTLNEKIMSYIEFESDFYHLSSYQQYNYLISQSAPLYQAMYGITTTGITEYGALLLPYLLAIYDVSHSIENQFPSINQQSEFAHLKNIFDTENLCNYLHLFTESSIYYGVTFEKSECQSIANGILTKNLKAAFVYFTETGVELINKNMNPQKMTKAQRVAYLEGSELTSMKNVLAYQQQFYKILGNSLMLQINSLIDNSISTIVKISLVLMFGLIIIIKALNYRWDKIRNEAKHVQSILRLISFKEILKDKNLREQFILIDYTFYE